MFSLARKEIIVDPCDVPAIPNEPSTIVASRLNECVRMLNFLVEKQETSMQPPGPVIWPSVPAQAQPSVPVVLSNVPINLNIRNPVNQREFVEKLGYADKVQHIVAKKIR